MPFTFVSGIWVYTKLLREHSPETRLHLLGTGSLAQGRDRVLGRRWGLRQGSGACSQAHCALEGPRKCLLSG